MRNTLALIVTFVFTGIVFHSNAQVTDPTNPNYKPPQKEACAFSVPTAFSENGDGMNDCIQVNATCEMTAFTWTVFNRWGQKVFETKDPKECWMGDHKDKPLPMGTYYWVVEFNWKGERKQNTGNGHLTIIR
jgi:gliding motility-associated-like protein